MKVSQIRFLFFVAGLYDFLIGLAFLLFGVRLFDAAGVPQPDHWGYIQFGALMLMIFGTMFFAIASNPVGHRQMIPYGMLLKLSYSALAGYYWATTDCPLLFKPFVVIDAIMLALFVIAYKALPANAVHPDNAAAPART